MFLTVTSCSTSPRMQRWMRSVCLYRSMLLPFSIRLMRMTYAINYFAFGKTAFGVIHGVCFRHTHTCQLTITVITRLGHYQTSICRQCGQCCYHICYRYIIFHFLLLVSVYVLIIKPFGQEVKNNPYLKRVFITPITIRIPGIISKSKPNIVILSSTILPIIIFSMFIACCIKPTFTSKLASIAAYFASGSAHCLSH